MTNKRIIISGGGTARRYTRSRDNMKAKWLPNGNLRFYTDDPRKSGCRELQCNHMRNASDTVITAGPLNVIIEYDL